MEVFLSWKIQVRRGGCCTVLQSSNVTHHRGTSEPPRGFPNASLTGGACPVDAAAPRIASIEIFDIEFLAYPYRDGYVSLTQLMVSLGASRGRRPKISGDRDVIRKFEGAHD